MNERVLFAFVGVHWWFCCFLTAAPADENRQRATQLWTEGITDVSGLAALTAFSDLPYDNQDLESVCEMKRNAVRDAFQATGDYLAHLEAAASPSRDDESIMKLHHQLGQLYSYQGEMNQAIRHFEAAHAIADKRNLVYFRGSLEQKLGIAQLRRGEMENCVENHNARSCIFPIAPEARHAKTAGSKAAIDHFLNFLSESPDNLEVRWLLNVAFMTLGAFPEKVPEAYRIPPAAFRSRYETKRFGDVASQLGLDTSNMAGGTIVDDFDLDGLFDIVISSQDSCVPLRYFHNDGRGKFSDRSAQSGLDTQFGGLNLVQTDYNNDGRPDIFVLRGGWEFPTRNSLLRNNADGTFTDITQQSGLAQPATATQTAAWADFDLDGWLDVFVGNELAPSQLFRNRGDGAFIDVARSAGVDRIAFTKGSVWGDIDNDGYPDLYVSNYGEKNFLYHNNRDGTFTEVAHAAGVEQPLHSFPTWFMDFDNDGWLDLFVSGYVQSLADIASEYLGKTPTGETFKVYRNTGKGRFQDVTSQVGLARNALAMGCNFGDIDNDGYLDFYLGTGAPSYGALTPNLLFRNADGRAFKDVTSASGTGHLQKGHGIAFADLNNDGGQEIFLHSGGAVPGDSYRNAVFWNPGHGNHWLGIRLQGEKSNRAAIGARLRLVLPGGREIHREVTSGGSFGASPLEQLIGLGDSSRIEKLEVSWPTRGGAQVFRNLKSDQYILVKESSVSPKSISKRSFHLSDQKESHRHTASVR